MIVTTVVMVDLASYLVYVLLICQVAVYVLAGVGFNYWSYLD